jgi:hypothetical protein
MADSPAARLSHAYLDDDDNRRPPGRNMTMVMAMSAPRGSRVGRIRIAAPCYRASTSRTYLVPQFLKRQCDRALLENWRGQGG